MMLQCRFWPHLVIYLDVPVDKCLENIRRQGNARFMICFCDLFIFCLDF